MKKIILLLFISSLMFSCSNNKKFSQDEWNENVDFPVNIERDKMVEDLMANYLNKPLLYDEVVGLLGKPDKIDSNEFSISYMVYIEFEFLGIDETEIKFLDICFSQDSIIKLAKRRSWKKGE